ncbi:hypothetical protein ACMFMG_007989 [Clarireedia jacksonii]
MDSIYLTVKAPFIPNLKLLYFDFLKIRFIMKNLLSTLFLAAIATGVRAVPVSPNTLDSRSLAAKTAYTVDAYGKEIAAADAVEVLSRGLAVDNMGTKGIAPVLGFGIVHAIG